MPTVKHITQIIEEIAPKDLALPGDPVGLQCGDPGRLVKRLMIALDAIPGTVDQAVKAGADLLVTHHPLLFEPLTPATIYGPAGAALSGAIREGLAVYSAHTNLDASPRGINESVADLLGLTGRKALQVQAGEGGLFKLVVFVPPHNLEKVRSAAFSAGAGRVGNYSGCSFTVEGTGTFRPEKGSSPAIGQRGRSEKVREVRLEVGTDSLYLEKVLSGIRAAHPYEEPVVDIYPVTASSVRPGMGISGRLPSGSTVGEIALKLSASLKAGVPRLVGRRSSRVLNVAVCAGSGASLMDSAVSAGAQLFITGDMKYHDARKAESLGLEVLDVGHFPPERYGMNRFAGLLRKEVALRGLDVEIVLAKERDPLVPLG